MKGPLFHFSPVWSDRDASNKYQPLQPLMLCCCCRRCNGAPPACASPRLAWPPLLCVLISAQKVLPLAKLGWPGKFYNLALVFAKHGNSLFTPK